MNASDIVLDTPIIVAEGTVNATAVSGLSSLVLSFDAQGEATAPLNLTCPAAFASEVSVTVNAERVKLVEAGLYPVISATSLEAVDLKSWVLDADKKLTDRRALSLVKDGNTIFLKVDRLGMSITIR